MGALILTGVAPGALVACSGGRDSVALLHAVHRAGLKPRAITIDHGLGSHGAQAAAHVASLCARWRVPHRIVAVAVGVGEGPEDAARRARHAALRAEAERLDAPSILLAHSADDQLETVLMRVASGTGAAGLAGMAVHRGRLHRPWLGVARARIAEYAQEHGLAWIEDPSNASLGFRRNRVRHLLAPALSATFGEGWRAGVLASARLACIEADTIAQRAPGLEALIERDGMGAQIELAALDPLSAADQRVIFRALVAGLPPRRRRSAMDVLGGLAASTGGARALDLPGPWRASRVADRLRVERIEGPSDDARP